ncbi:MAG: DUF3990 domain-containing protein [Spirochaetales bacterium]|jgi:hypothetical protein|nr:DUF3990 domain-containing protein [Spirochaetales bacterium]
MTVFHGSNTEIDRIDLEKCRPQKDFGCGFYTTIIREQSLSMAKRTVRIYGGRPVITEFSFDEAILSDPRYAIKKFDKPDNAWALFVINNRNPHFQTDADSNIDNRYDIVMGPVANDDLITLFNLYQAGNLSEQALAIEMTHRQLTNQISFHTERAVKGLHKTGVFYGH